jgi:transposase-like protein
MEFYPDVDDTLTTCFRIYELLDRAKCYDAYKTIRWLDGVICVRCKSAQVKKDGHHDTDPDRQRYKCECGCRFDDLTGTIFEGRHQPVTIWIMAMYYMGLNLFNAQVAKELDLNIHDVHDMLTAIRDAVCQKKPTPILKNIVEADEAYNKPVTNGARLTRYVTL